MVTYAQAQEIAEDWINAGVPRSRQREVRVREFDLGFVCWAVEGSEGAPSEGGEVRLVIARDSGASTLWPPLPVNEVVRRFEEAYGGRAEPNPAGAARPVPGAVEATSFLLSPPQWLQEAGAAAIAAENARLGAPGDTARAAAERAAAQPAPAAPAVQTMPPVSDRPAGDAPTMLAPPSDLDALRERSAGAVPSGSEGLTVPMPVPPPGSEGLTVPMPATAAPAATVAMPEGFGFDAPPAANPAPPTAPPPFPGPGTPSAGTPVPPVAVEYAPTMLATPDQVPPPPPGPGASGPGVEYAPTMLATDGPPGLMGLPGAPGTPPAGVQLGRSGPSVPPPPPPGELRGAAGPSAAGAGRSAPSAPPPPPPGELRGGAGPSAAGAGRSAPSAPPPPAPASLAQGGPAAQAAPAAPDAAGVAHAATQLAHAIDLPGGPGASGPGAPGPAMPPPPAGVAAVPGPPPPGYGYPGAGPVGAPPAVPAPPAPAPQAAPVAPPAAGVPTIGPGTQAVISYRRPDGSEQSLVMASEPGTPHPEWKALQEMRRLGVPPDQVLEFHTELELCDLPGGYCARMVKSSWPNVRITHTVPYGRDRQARQAGMAMLLDHLDQLHQLAAAPQRPRPVQAPLPPPGSVPQLPPIPPQQLAGELGQAFGGAVFRFEQRAVSRQGVPEAVAQTLMWAGLPREFAPFFWAQAQEGRPIPTLAELAAERGRPAGPDFGGYLVLGNDYGRQLCVQYGTAAVVAVDLEGTGEPPRFVNTGVPEFVRSLAVLGRMWRLRYGLTPEQAGRWTTDLQAQLLAVDPAALHTPEGWWAVLLEQLWDGLM
ncbi:SUKH-4 family immunity protein [Streptomyces sp. NRRL B-24484]|uniref:SUKH-4 family immunity protein n=1 Tax=Streptomyces sp. NRRL B-24484 TaxID=1463833 RepID=UPI0004C20F30|nr:SUKH-4 family immunity protein [Streptomyces sp. NRRL B-24484]